MPFKINGTTITLQPTSHRWVNRDQMAIDGNQHPAYPGIRSYELKWELISASDWNQLQGFFNTVGVTGSVVATLPKFADSTYNFFDYTGCVLSEPQVNDYFEEHVSDVILVVSRIRT
jgi:hypothetical protein